MAWKKRTSGNYGGGIMLFSVMSTTMRSRFSQAARFMADRRGAAAIEFALIAPLLLSLYFVTMEVGQGIETNKKVSRVGSLVADLITQQNTITAGEIDAIMNIGAAILQPYGRSNPTIKITAIEVTNESSPKVKVVWSRKLVDGESDRDETPGLAPARPLPDKLKVKGTFLIRVQSELDYEPVITWNASPDSPLGLGVMGKIFKDGILEMGEVYYLRPRASTTIPCTGC